MRKLEEMDHEEILALSEDQIERMIDYRCAESGIKLLLRPVEPEDPKIEGDVIVYSIANINSEDLDFIQKILTLITKNKDKIVETDYDYNGPGSDYSYVKPVDWYTRSNYFEINKKIVFSSHKFDQLKSELTAYHHAKSSYKSAKEEFSKADNERSEIAKSVHREINAHRALSEQLKAAKENYDRYLDLSDNDTAMAGKFWNDAFEEADDYIRHQVSLHGGFAALEENQFEPDIETAIRRILKD